MANFTLAVVAGGKSTRMGRDKSFVVLNGRPLIEHVLERTRGLGQAETILIVNQPTLYAHLGLPMFADLLPDKGSLGGIYTAIHHSGAPHTLCVACDMPFLNAELLRYQISLAPDYDVVAPRVDHYPEGLHAVYSRACLPAIHARLAADRLKVIGFYQDVRARYLDEPEWQRFDPEGLSFRNINTPGELDAAGAIVPQN
jgi:molybdopterin-guanine dinucleotide biosynthesis protein A